GKWESNPSSSFGSNNGFEDREAHQLPYYLHEKVSPSANCNITFGNVNISKNDIFQKMNKLSYLAKIEKMCYNHIETYLHHKVRAWKHNITKENSK
ncbi:MAG: hypothetical protein FWB92_11750, partial [Oscillospiraceae bacterium]|nr:hypothetical protein [Oscillospiraceae bacterium]